MFVKKKKVAQGFPDPVDLDDDIVSDDVYEDDDYESDDEFDESWDDFNTGFERSADVYKVWLDTEPYLNSIYLSLTNQKIKRTKITRNGRDYWKNEPVPIKEGVEPLANDVGVSQLMSELRVFLSSPLVQGNLDKEMYSRFMLWYDKKVNKLLYSRRIDWGIGLHDVEPLYNRITGSVQLFLTRPINNLERGREHWRPNKEEDLEQPRGFFEKIRGKRNKRRGVAFG